MSAWSELNMDSSDSSKGTLAGEPVPPWTQKLCISNKGRTVPLKAPKRETNKPLKCACCQPSVFKECVLHLGRSLMLVLPWFQLQFSPAIIQAEAGQLLGPCQPHILSVTLLRDIMYRGAPATPPPSYLHPQLRTWELRGKAIRLSLLIGGTAKPPSTKKSFDSCWSLLIIHWWVELPKGDILKVHAQNAWTEYLIICFIFHGEKK